MSSSNGTHAAHIHTCKEVAAENPSIREPIGPSDCDSEVQQTQTQSGCGMRKKQPMWKILESLPQPVAPTPIIPEVIEPPVPLPGSSIHIWTVCALANQFGLYREYIFLNSISEIPDDICMLADMSYQS